MLYVIRTYIIKEVGIMKKAVGIIGAVAIVAVAGFVVYKLFASDRKNIEAYPQIVQVL